MPREPRDIEPGATYHLISRFVDREWFIRKQGEREHYLQLLGRSLSVSRWRLLAFAVMSNHIHLGVVAGPEGLDTWVRRVHAPFASTMNRTYDRIGPMFVRGPKAYLVQNRDVGNLIAYIHNNPVRAEVVSRPCESTWTSHRAYVGAAPCPPWLHRSRGLALAGFHDPQDFDRWVADPARKVIDADFTEEAHERALAMIRADKEAARARIERPGAPEIVSAAARVVGIPLPMMRSRSRGELEVLARTVAIHAAVSWGLPGVEIADAVGVSQPAVSVIKRRPLCERAGKLMMSVQRLVSNTDATIATQEQRGQWEA